MVVQIRIFSLLLGVGCRNRNRDRIAKAFGYKKADHFRYLLAKTTWNLASKKPIPIPMPTQTPNKERLTSAQQDKILICTTIALRTTPTLRAAKRRPPSPRRGTFFITTLKPSLLLRLYQCVAIIILAPKYWLHDKLVAPLEVVGQLALG